MKKLKLEIDQLAVESFTTSPGMEGHGTVQGFGTQFGRTCGAVNTCGPQTCGDMYCVIDTGDACGGTVGCPAPTVGCQPPSGMLSCVGCTTQNYTNAGGDTCDFCMSFGSDIPARCPCP
ncbi:MAG TPA: hypothetical protein VFE05_06980 [Longimicrobiaceae bacterium]|jgi:hypothetical protein|nr:hypothetical protein [Longimicrobiaceae bacterium]